MTVSKTVGLGSNPSIPANYTMRVWRNWRDALDLKSNTLETLSVRIRPLAPLKLTLNNTLKDYPYVEGHQCYSTLAVVGIS